MDSFEMIKSLDDDVRFTAVLQDLFGANNITDPKEKFPVFTGTICLNEQGKKRVGNICSAWGSPINKNPYSDKPLMTLTGLGYFNIDERIVFIGKCGALNYRTEILNVNVCRTFDSLALPSDAEPGDILNVIYHISEFENYKAQIKELLEEYKEFGIEKTHLDRIKQEIREADDLFKEYKELKKIIKDEFPEGVEKTRVECDELLTKRKELCNQVNSLSFQKAELDGNCKRLNKEYAEATKEFEELEKKADNYVPEGKTVEEVLKALDEYYLQKPEIEKARKFAEWFLEKHERIENEIPLPEEEMESLETLKNRLDYDYSDDLIIPFMSALATRQIITLFGKPGTGKTTFVRKLAKALGAKCTIVSVQNNWTDSSDLLGYYNPVDNIFTSTRFLEALIDANTDYANNDDISDSKLHIICLDEMNLARVEYYFAEFLSLLQLNENERWIEVLPSYKEKELKKLREKEKPTSTEKDELDRLGRYRKFKIPPNVRFVGTINSDDTTNALSPKVIDRSFFIELRREDYAAEKEPPKIDGYYPLSFFQPKQIPCDLEIFEKENGRFKHYIQQMYSFYHNRLGIHDDDSFINHMILGKILPAIRRLEEFTGSEYDNEIYTLAQERFLTHKGSGDYYDYLGSN